MKTQDQKIEELRNWMVSKGCIIHPNLTIPSRINGVQGVGTNASISPKTLIVAIPSHLILTVTRCYNDPLLKKLFLANDDLFDYEASEDAEFNVLCVFMMYHKLNIEGSEWKAYLETIAEPQTAVDWEDKDLKGLNKSLIEEIIHIRIECQKLQDELVQYLSKRKQFSNKSIQQLRSSFKYCYRAVMTRCFGYYFNQACLIPIADLINHSCQAVDHQLLNVNFQNQLQFQEGYYLRKQKIDCRLLGIKGPESHPLPFRERFLVQNKIIDAQQKLQELNREKIDSILYEWNRSRFRKGQKLKNLHFCSEDEEEDNDTDEQFEVEQIRQLEHCHKTQQQQMKDFMENYVAVQNYIDVQRKLKELNGEEEELNGQEKFKEGQNLIDREQKVQQKQQSHLITTSNIQQNYEKMQEETIQSTEQTHNIIEPQTKQKSNLFSYDTGRGVPIQMVESSSQSDEDQQQWGLKQGSYFTMSTSSPVGANCQLYNSYGSRTNKFLLIWYGFTYPKNLYDSVTVRLQVQFGQLRPAHEIVLDSYIGGQGLSFKKPNMEVVKQNEISRQFRFKRNCINNDLLYFLRLYLMNYYKGQDLYKLFVTFPSSVDFEIFVFTYYRDVVVALYDRYPAASIQDLRQDMQSSGDVLNRMKIKYKIIYLEEQRQLLSLNERAVNSILSLLSIAKTRKGILRESDCENLPIEVIRMIRKYLVSYIENQRYILYDQAELDKNKQILKNNVQKLQKPHSKDEDEDEDEDYEDVDEESGSQQSEQN